ncbi:hypothetical protein P280DRAFT_520893 [Massarina eburnea CBS 473.64]|uniref:Uncharacterized protein n=1 Tax=Massarina eburnea CBS 473.64 TaxID=1395130 RepID=A0A6A6RQX6_9PLEO|nr:hypothetical protein P280DRAFT_520893 [Massarina eburnea CBS 473.64]
MGTASSDTASTIDRILKTQGQVLRLKKEAARTEKHCDDLKAKIDSIKFEEAIKTYKKLSEHGTAIDDSVGTIKKEMEKVGNNATRIKEQFQTDFKHIFNAVKDSNRVLGL